MCVTILYGLLDGKALAALAQKFVAAQSESGHPLQSGVRLDLAPFANDLLAPLVSTASEELKSPARLFFDKSSCRVQRSDGERQLSPHQDGATVGFSPVLTFWCPLTHITPRSPSLAISLRDDELMPHEKDERGYVVLGNWNGQLTPLPELKPGDVVMISPNVVHATYMPPDAEGTRVSLDVRAGLQ